MEPFCLIFPVAKFVTEYFDLVDSTSKQVERLLHQSFTAAIEMLDSARYADGKNRETLIAEARVKFYEAIRVEQNENLMLALVGLSMCHALLGDIDNAKRYHNRIREVQLTTSEKVKDSAKKVGEIINPIWGTIVLINDIVKGKFNKISRAAAFNQKKLECRKKTRSIIEQIERQLSNSIHEVQ